ncbi:MAG: glycosyltransferase [Sphingomonas bacterium]|nr:glycosyltransferase [Sphingomonas bacterium]
MRRIVVGMGPLPLPRSLAGVGALEAYLGRERPDVLMAGSNFSHVVAALACAALARPPLLVLRAGSHPLRQLPWSRPAKRLREYLRRPIERWALRRADLVIAVSRESAAAIAALVSDPAKITVIANPTITADFRASLGTRVEHRWFDEAEAGGEPVIVAVGRIAQSKDFETLVEAMAITNRTTPAKLILFGEGQRRGVIEALVARRGLTGRVELMGHVEGVGGWLARADLLVSSSLWEGSPGAIIEAFEAGLPVVATACPGGSVELIEGSSGGMLVPVRDAAAMAAAIVTMLERPRDREALRALAKPYQDDGRAEMMYLAAIEAALAKMTAAPGRAPPSLD